jgi:hypothetical protein
MKNNLLMTLLNGVLAFFLLAAVIMTIQYVSVSRNIRQLNSQMAGINAWRNGALALAADCMEYSKKNQEIVPILKAAGLTGDKTAAPTKPVK